MYRTRWTDGGLPPAHSGRAVCLKPLVGRVEINNYGVNGPPYDPTRKPNAILSEAELYPHSDSIAAGLEFEYININNSKKSGVVFECIRSSNHIEFPEYAYKLKSCC